MLAYISEMLGTVVNGAGVTWDLLSQTIKLCTYARAFIVSQTLSKHTDRTICSSPQTTGKKMWSAIQIHPKGQCYLLYTGGNIVLMENVDMSDFFCRTFSGL